jgi:hypothetical protein
MLDFVAQNLGSILVGLALTGIVAAIILHLLKTKKQGKCVGCSGGCEGCGSGAICDKSR